MTINELYVQLDLQVDIKSKIAILDDVARKCDDGYLFVDSDDGKMHLFDKYGNTDDINKVKSIKDNAFVGHKSLINITIPNNVKSIGYNAFNNCKSLTSIIIPNSVRSIRDYAFYDCESLTSISIPDSVESIGANAFCDCEDLINLTFKNKTLDEVKSMSYYPWGIEDKSIIKCI